MGPGLKLASQSRVSKISTFLLFPQFFYQVFLLFLIFPISFLNLSLRSSRATRPSGKALATSLDGPQIWTLGIPKIFSFIFPHTISDNLGAPCCGKFCIVTRQVPLAFVIYMFLYQRLQIKICFTHYRYS